MLTTEARRAGSAARIPVRDLVDALLQGDDAAAFGLTRRVLEQTGSRTAVFADLLHAAQVEVGDLWYSGRVSYMDEVRVAAAVRRIVEQLPATPVARPVRSGTRCMLAVPHGDPHDLGLMMLTLALQDHGWSTEVIAPARSLYDIADIVAGRRPRLFGLSAGDLPQLPQLERAMSAIRRAQVPVLVGGVAFNRRPDLWRRLEAHGLGTDVRVGVVLAQRLAGR
ncbi:MAG TPA: cobalamin B12-binding domain-containing protein [Candidatus Eisenbacteria bacterium]|nr:cobalamin B12-binding domain-containing protein [Candidatus Eisenbacteria bacterium]